ncbi:MAG: hypothetical protein AAFX93_11950 [Verrucomicrobiota bacterium]
MRTQRTILSALFGLTQFVAVGNSGVYSLGLSDNENVHDSPIPGFVGPEGEGIVPTEVSEDSNVVNPIFLSWADTVIDYSPALGEVAPGFESVREPLFKDPAAALGPVTGLQEYDVVSLGELNEASILAGDQPGMLTVAFSEPIVDGTGADFVIFENAIILSILDTGGAGIGGIWTELAYVEVSSNGTDFARFPAHTPGLSIVGPYGSNDPRNIYNLAGKHVNADGDSWGTPFDLSDLEDHPLVVSGDLDLDQITQIRLIDIPGSGDFLDAFGNPIYDGWITYDTGGADIEALGAISQKQTFERWNSNRGFEPLGNDDNDQWCHLQEYAFGLDPGQFEQGNIPDLQAQPDGNYTLSFPRDERITDIDYVVEQQGTNSPSNSWTEIARFSGFEEPAIDDSAILTLEISSTANQAAIGVLQKITLLLPPPSGPEFGVFYRIRLEATE